VEEDGADGLGIRSPQADGYWGVAAAGTLADRRALLDTNNPAGNGVRAGKVYSAYLELRDDRLLGVISGTNPDGEPIIAFPGEAGYSEPNPVLPPRPRVVVDYWGRPIRYYRSLYRMGAISQPYRDFYLDASDNQSPHRSPPTLADVYVLRPWEVPAGGGVTSKYEDAVADSTATTLLKAAPFALLSSGPDKKLDDAVRRDSNTPGAPHDKGFNEDNLVEVAK
jgi:hypothetical protein